MLTVQPPTRRPLSLLSDPKAAQKALARAKFGEFIQLLYGDDYKRVAFMRHLISVLEAVERGEKKRVIIVMPPGHTKSTHASVYFPAWYLGRNPNKEIIAASYGETLASGFAKRARGLFKHEDWPFPNVRLDPSGAAADDWRLEPPWRGGYRSAGIGGSITGRRANCILIDDPVKGWQDAKSETVRETAWNWFTSEALTRLQPDGAIVIIGCLTGDVRVSLEDGTDKPISEIRAGDRVLTYDDGDLAVETVTNWINHGPDDVFAIRMKSGTIVKANARHPWLVDQDGERSWQRTDTLRKGQHILRGIGESTGASPVPQRGATSLQSAEACARPITTRPDGQRDTVLLPSTSRVAGKPTFVTAMALAVRNTMRFLRRKAVSARCAVSRQTGNCVASSLLTTATQLEPCADCSATIATSLSDTAETERYSTPLDAIWTTDEIISVEPCGREDVFDIEVSRTENFLANGLVSHNTRWHEDDLIGRCLSQEYMPDTKWEVIHYPARAEDEDILGREPGDYLWPEYFTPEIYEEREKEVGPTIWTTLYQGMPFTPEGDIFKRENWMSYRMLPNLKRVAVFVDSAFKDGVGNDFSVFALWGDAGDGRYFVIDLWRERVQFPELTQAGWDLDLKWRHMFMKSGRPIAALPFVVEDAASGQSAIQVWSRPFKDGDEVIREALTVIPFKLPPGMSKEARNEGVSPYQEAHQVYLPEFAEWRELFIAEHAAFPSGKHDDIVDTTGMALMTFAQKPKAGARSH